MAEDYYDLGGTAPDHDAAHQPTGLIYGFQGGSGIEFVSDPVTSTLQLGTVTVPGMYEYSEGGGQDAPIHKAEAGYDYTTRVDAEPLEATFSAYVRPHTLQELRTLRDAPEPFPVYVKSTRLAQCVLSNLDISESGETNGAVTVEISVREVQQGQTREIGLVVISGTGAKGDDPDSKNDDPTYKDNEKKGVETRKEGFLSNLNSFFRGPSKYEEERAKAEAAQEAEEPLDRTGVEAGA